jgi:hypothetical protein
MGMAPLEPESFTTACVAACFGGAHCRTFDCAYGLRPMAYRRTAA